MARGQAERSYRREIVERQDPLRQALDQYKQKFDEAKQQFASLSGSSLQQRLQALRRQQGRRALESTELSVGDEALRTQLISLMPAVESSMRNVVAKMRERYSQNGVLDLTAALRQITEFGSQNDVPIVLIQQMVSAEWDRGKRAQLTQYTQPAMRANIDAGFQFINSGASERPSELLGEDIPQLVALGSFLDINIVRVPNPIAQAIVRHNITDTAGFVRHVMPLFQAFLREQNLDQSRFCPNAEWFTKLCNKARISSRLAQIDVSSVTNSEVARAVGGRNSELVAAANKRADEAAERHTRFTREARVLRTRATALLTEANALTNNPTLQAEKRAEAGRLNARATQLEADAAAAERDRTQARNEATGYRSLLNQARDAAISTHVMAGFGSNVDVDTRHLPGIVAAPFEMANKAMDFIASKMPTPGNFRDMNVFTMALKLVAGGAVMVNLITMGTQQVVHAGKFASNLSRGQFREAAGEIPAAAKSFLGNWSNVGLTALFGAGVLAIDNPGRAADAISNAASRVGSVSRDLAGRAVGQENVDSFISTLGGAATWVKEGARRLWGSTKEGFNDWVYNPASNAISTMRDWTPQKWEEFKAYADKVGVDWRQYREHVAAMDSMRDALKNNRALSGVDISAFNANTDTFDRFLMYCRDLNGGYEPRGNGRLTINLRQMVRLGYITQANYDNLSASQTEMTLTPQLSRTLLQRAKWAAQNNPRLNPRVTPSTPTA